MNKRVAGTGRWGAAAVGLGLLWAQGLAGVVHAGTVAGLADLVCVSDGYKGTSTAPKCSSFTTPFPVQVFSVTGPTASAPTGAVGCVAALPYNSIKVLLAQDPTDKVVLHWKIQTVGEFDSASGGIVFDPLPNGSSVRPPAAAITTAVPTKTTVDVTFGALRDPTTKVWTWTYGHLPVVLYAGQPCTGVDPIIVNSAD